MPGDVWLAYLSSIPLQGRPCQPVPPRNDHPLLPCLHGCGSIRGCSLSRHIPFARHMGSGCRSLHLLLREHLGLTLITALKKVPRVHQNPRYTSMRPRLKFWAKLPRTSGTWNESLLKLWKCTNTSATRTWRMSPSPTHKTDYQSNTDLMATTKMYIAQTNTS